MKSKAPISRTGWQAGSEADLEELEAGLRIDKLQLDEECIDQPNRYFQVSEAMTLAISQRDMAKQELTEIEAVVDAEIRHAAEVAEEKCTEKMVESQKSLDKRVLKVKERLKTLQIKVGRASALKDSYHQRRYMLQGLIDLHLGGYFGSADSVPRAVRDRNAEVARGMHKERYKDSTHERRTTRGDD